MPRPTVGWTDVHRRLHRRQVIGACAAALSLGTGGLARQGCVAHARGSIGTPGEEPFEERVEAAFRRLERLGPTAIVGISHDGGPIVVREFGALQQDDGPSGATQVDLNSITKTVTGVMVLKLAEQGGVRLDETLADVFTSVPADKGGIEVHHLLTHSAGLVAAVGSDYERIDREGFLRRVFGTSLLAPPGAEYNYSNVGYSVLAAIVEERSGKSYDGYLREDVLAGTGLRDTGYLSVYDEDRSLPASDGRAILEASWGGHEPFWNLIGNGGLISTAEDFIRFRQAVKAGKILSAWSVEASQTPHVAEDEAGTSHYGYGLVVQDAPAIGRFYWHDGGNDVFSAMWSDAVDRGDIVFTAAADTPAGDAFSVMKLMREHLYGVVSE